MSGYLLTSMAVGATLAVVGSVVDGLFWMTAAGIVLLLATAVLAGTRTGAR